MVRRNRSNFGSKFCPFKWLDFICMDFWNQPILLSCLKNQSGLLRSKHAMLTKNIIEFGKTEFCDFWNHFLDQNPYKFIGVSLICLWYCMCTHKRGNNVDYM